MVKHLPDLDLVFHALASETRRSIIESLAVGDRRVTDIAAGFDMTLPAVSKHLKILERAGLVSRTREGRVHRMSFEGAPLESAVGWIETHRRQWNGRFDALATLVERGPRRRPRNQGTKGRPG